MPLFNIQGRGLVIQKLKYIRYAISQYYQNTCSNFFKTYCDSQILDMNVWINDFEAFKNTLAIHFCTSFNRPATVNWMYRVLTYYSGSLTFTINSNLTYQGNRQENMMNNEKNWDLEPISPRNWSGVKLLLYDHEFTAVIPHF